MAIFVLNVTGSPALYSRQGLCQARIPEILLHRELATLGFNYSIDSSMI